MTCRALLLVAGVSLVAAGCGGAGKTAEQTATRRATAKHLTAAQRKYMGSQYCAEDWNTNTLNPSQPSAANQYGQFLTIYPKIRIYEIRQRGPGPHPAFTCALIAATAAGQISDVYADTFDGSGWHLDQTDARSMQVNGVAATYPPNASMTASGRVQLGEKARGQPSRQTSTSPGSVSQAAGSTSAALRARLVAAMSHSRFVGNVTALKLTSLRVAPLTHPTWASGRFSGLANGSVVGDFVVFQRTPDGTWVVRDSGACVGFVVPAQLRAVLHTPAQGCSAP